jgi:hypothetical protein
MTPEMMKLIVNLIPLVVSYGVPAVIKGIGALEKDEITLEDIESLRGLIKPPGDY